MSHLIIFRNFVGIGGYIMRDLNSGLGIVSILPITQYPLIAYRKENGRDKQNWVIFTT